MSGNAINIPTRILAIADTYGAMIRDRPNRRAIVSKEALRKLMLEHGGKSDERLTQILIKEIGVFPPGAIVQLANNEIAVVKERKENGAFPIVYSFIDPSGDPIGTPERRETENSEHKIKDVLPLSQHRESLQMIRNVWATAPA